MTLAATTSRWKEPLPEALLATAADATIGVNGFVETKVDPSFLGPRLAAICSGMERVTDDPVLQKLFPFRIHAEDAYGKEYKQEVGLIRRNDNERKWWFHYTPEAYPENHFRPEELRYCGALLSALRDLDAKAREIGVEVAQSFDSRYSAKAGRMLYADSMVRRLRLGRCITRVLRYLPAKGNAADAHPHIDRGLFTIHWGATHEGLWVYTPDGERVRVRETEYDTVALFPGRKYGAIFKGALGDGTPHGVRYERKDERDRYAIVSFLHPAAYREDVDWLLENNERIKKFQESIHL